VINPQLTVRPALAALLPSSCWEGGLPQNTVTVFPESGNPCQCRSARGSATGSLNMVQGRLSSALFCGFLFLSVPSSLSTCPSDPPPVHIHPSMVRGRRPYSVCLAVSLFENFFSSIRPRAPTAGSVKVARLSFLPTIFPGLSASLCQWTSYHSSVLFTPVRPSVLYSCGGEPIRSMARSVCNR
jgi:hypothetical protein